MKHTPGNWEYTSEYPYGRDIRTDNIWIGDVKGPHDGIEGFPSSEECEANARLIAAAPDLLEALEELVAYYGTDNSEAIDKGVKAITKAKGD